MNASDTADGVADVYAGDAHRECSTRHCEQEYLFAIEVEPEPDALMRVTMVFNLANRAPRSLHFQSDSEGRATIAIEIGLASAVQADLIRRKTEQLTCTLAVSLTEISRT